MLLVFATSSLANRAPLVSWLAFGFLAAMSILRLILLARMHKNPNPRLWQVQHTTLVLSCAAIWGLVPAYATYVFGRYDQDTMIAYLFHAAIAVGTVTLLIHDVRLIRVALSLLFAPSIAAQILAGGHGFWNPISIYVLYMLYLSTTGRKLNLAYWQQISDNHDLAMLAHHDSLTGLANRLLMDDALQRSLAEARERRRQVAMLYVDFDGFKQINDQHSHKIGDLFLCEVAQRLAECVDTKGVVARFGGDEFTALITDCASSEEAAEIAAEVLCAARAPVLIEGKRLACTVSIGVSIFPDHAADAEDLVRAADKAMYAAKISGKNRICFSVPTARDPLNSVPLLNMAS